MNNSYKLILVSIIVISIGIILLYGCTKDLGDYDTDEYVLLINLKKPDGVDVLKDIPTTGTSCFRIVDDIDGWTRKITNELYCFHMTQPKEFSMTPLLPLPVTKISDNYYLTICFTDNIRSKYYNHLAFKLTCSYIFGDDEEHTIVTYWNPNGMYMPNNDSPRIECNRLTIDGIQYQVNQELIPNFRDKRIIENTPVKDCDLYRFISVAKIIL